MLTTDWATLGLTTLSACSNAGNLLEVDPATGTVTVGPDLVQPDCNNLAAPYGSVTCIPPIF